MAFPRNAAILQLADRFLGDLPEYVLATLGLQTTARRVLISAAQQRHAIERRAISSKADADLVALRLTEAVSNVRYHLLPQKDARTFALVGYTVSAQRHLVLVVKLVAAVNAKTKEDEWWVQTAIPLGRKNLRRAKESGRLVALQPGL